MEKITLKSTILKPVDKVWEFFTQPEHITQWNFATPEWSCPKAVADLRDGGRFSYRMEAKDGSFGFDYAGTFDEVLPNERLTYTLDDGRRVEVHFEHVDAATTDITEIFEPEASQPVEMQREGWQKILHNFEQYAEHQA